MNLKDTIYTLCGLRDWIAVCMGIQDPIWKKRYAAVDQAISLLRGIAQQTDFEHPKPQVSHGKHVLTYHAGYIFGGATFVPDKTLLRNATDAEFVRGTALIPAVIPAEPEDEWEDEE